MTFSTKPKERTHEERMAEEHEVAAELQALALAVEVEAIAKRDSAMLEVEKEFSADVEKYAFECRRWGDFLSLMIKRSPISWNRIREDRSYATAINIRETREIKLIHGTPADCNGSLNYGVSMVSTDHNGSSWGTGYGRFRAPKGYRYDVRPNYPQEPYRQMFYLDSKKECSGGAGGGMLMPDPNTIIRHRTEPYPRFAVDDVIRFEGIGGTLYCPFGIGQRIHETILTEIGDHFEKMKRWSGDREIEPKTTNATLK